MTTATPSTTPPENGCSHTPPCPEAVAPDCDAARLKRYVPEQGWSLLCNGVLLFDDTGELLPDGNAVAPRRPIPSSHPVSSKVAA
ncbi:DUF5999 family protein [Streptomyces sp. NPDC015032]|uniref:DUF5999 family protein n=1 Tax=Streptomyces sp. NPDC015032 TaxID=3364937 RepID=UPI003701235B